jgi:DNA (cytosine-5)-methyltransferase 1
MRYLSLFSGIEAASVAWHDLGWTPVAFAEIEKFPSAVLKHRFPNVPNWGDVTKYQEWPDEPVDLLVGGTPCQSFSVAGLRKGLEDPRGNLMLTYLAIARRYRPRWVVWENVPGVLSSGGGRDFGTFLGALGELGYGWAYRVLDAQWFGVAQRRRRVFVVAHLGDWQRAAQVLFERESVRRDSPPSREARQGAAASVGGGVASGGAGIAPHIFKVRGGVEREDGSRGSTNIGKQAGKGYLGSEERAFTLAAAQDQFVAQPVAFHNRQDPDVSGDITHPLGAKDNGMAVAQPVAFDTYNQTVTGDTAQTLCSRGDTPGGNAHLVPAVMQPVAIGLDEEQNACVEGFGTLKARMEGGGFEGSVMTPAMQVRRLTPVECERLQGFPDGYTNIPWRKKPEAPDGPRYKALGNSMAVNCMRWIGERIQQVEDIHGD